MATHPDRLAVRGTRAGRGFRLLALTGVLLAVVLVGAPAASAAANYDLKGTWNGYATGGGYSGTFQITSMDMATGDFAGTGNSGQFALQGTETGSSVKFTQTCCGGYVATDTATLQSTSSGLRMNNGTWSDTNGSSGTFYATVTSPLRSSGVGVKCVAGATSTAPLSCTVTVSDTSATSPPTAPSGQVNVTASDGGLSASSCSLLATGPSAAACNLTYTPPPDVGYVSAPPVLTASYTGDAVFAASSGKLTIDCTSGLIFQVSGITSTVASTNGFHVGAPVSIHGCGLTAATVTRFGADNAAAKVAQPSDAAPDGTSLTLTVPEFALTGRLSITDAARMASLAKPDPVEIDSWRNTDGLSFANFGGRISEPDFLSQFPTSQLTVAGTPPGTTILKPWVSRFVGIAQTNIANGLCFGFAMTSGMFGDGALSSSVFDPVAKKGFGLAPSPALTHWLDVKWADQYSDQQKAFWIHAAGRVPGQVGIINDLNAAMPNGDGFSTPAVIGFYGRPALSNQLEGHAEIAYGWAFTPKPQDPGQITIYTADSNFPFTPAEQTDATGATHAAALAKSWIIVHGNGQVFAPGEGLNVLSGNLAVTPVSALRGTLTLNRPSTFHVTPLSVLLGPSDRVESFTGPAGRPLSLTQPSPGLTIVPQITASGPAARSTAHGLGVGGISQLIVGSPTSTLSLNAGAEPIAALWTGEHRDAALSAGPGHLRVNWQAAKGQLTVTGVSHEAAPHRVTVSLISQLAGDQVERIVTVSGPPQLRISLGSAATIFAQRPAIVRVSLSITGRGVTSQSAQLGALRLGAGQTLSLRPQSWAALTTTRFAGILTTSHGVVRRLNLHALGHMPTAVVSNMSQQGRRLRLKIRVPELLAGQSAVQAMVTISAHGREVARTMESVRSGGPTHTATLTLTLPQTRGARVEIVLVTINGGTTPSRTRWTLSRG